jgi:anti-anti-sigma regulatory factor
MRKRLLIITKEPEFDSRGEVVLGQCEPFTSGWKLSMILPDNGRETLLVGTYTDLRKVQESCAKVDEPDRVRKRVQELRALLVASITETVVAQVSGYASESTEGRTGPVLFPTRTPGGLFNLVSDGGLLVATVGQPERADDETYLKNELLAMLNWHPKAVLMDLGRVSNLSAGCFKELVGVRDKLREAGARFALCNLTHAMQQKVQTMKSKEALTVFDNLASALAGLKG